MLRKWNCNLPMGKGSDESVSRIYAIVFGLAKMPITFTNRWPRVVDASNDDFLSSGAGCPIG